MLASFCKELRIIFEEIRIFYETAISFSLVDFEFSGLVVVVFSFGTENVGRK